MSSFLLCDALTHECSDAVQYTLDPDQTHCDAVLQRSDAIGALQSAVLFGSEQYDLHSALLEEPDIQRIQLENGCAIEGAEADRIASEAFVDYFGRSAASAVQGKLAQQGVTDWYSACDIDLDGLMTSGAHTAIQVRVIGASSTGAHRCGLAD